MRNLVTDLATNIGLYQLLINQCVEYLQEKRIPLEFRECSSIIRSLQVKCNGNNITITKADKSSTVVVMGRSVYQNRAILSGADAVISPSFNFEQFNMNIRKVINDSKVILQSESQKKKSIFGFNPCPSKIYSLPNIHKPSIPLRPAVNYNSSPVYLLVQHLNQWYKSRVAVYSEHTVNNSLKLAGSAARFLPYLLGCGSLVSSLAHTSNVPVY